MKHLYERPAIKQADIEEDGQLLNGTVTNVESGDTDIEYGGGGSEPAHAPKHSSIWDDVDESDG